MIVIPITVKAEGNVRVEKHIVSIQVMEGDTLWSIAKQYNTSGKQDIRTYMKEIKRANGLVSDTIHEGCYLIVPIYVESRVDTTR